jgi:hypothetical protein
MKPSKWFLTGILFVLAAGWAAATQQPKAPVDPDPTDLTIASQKSAQKKYLKVGDYYIDASRITCAIRQPEKQGVYLTLKGDEKQLVVQGEKETADLLRWLDSVSFNPPSPR